MTNFDSRYTLTKDERLSLQSRIDLLFSKGESFIAYPLRIVYTTTNIEERDNINVSILASVSKRKFKRAVKRNRVKRLIRENYRLNKNLFQEISISNNYSIDIAFLYLKDELPEYKEIEKAIIKTASILTEKLLSTNINNEKNIS